jgi:hypothetical protein
MSIKTFIIKCVDFEYSEEYIANTLWEQRIAQVRSISLHPYTNTRNRSITNLAYVHISYWCDSENAYNFIQHLKDPCKEARIVHHVDEWWPVEMPLCKPHNQRCAVTFDSTYFKRYVVEEIIYKESDFTKRNIQSYCITIN